MHHRIIRHALPLSLAAVLLSGCLSTASSGVTQAVTEAAVSSTASAGSAAAAACTASTTTPESASYAQALKEIESRQYPLAMGRLSDLGSYGNAADLLSQLRDLVNGTTIGNGIWIAAGITGEGTMKYAYAGENSAEYAPCTDWKNLVALSCEGGDSIEALTQNGRILTTASESAEEYRQSSNASNASMADVVDAVSGWQELRAFQAFYPQSALGLMGDGTVRGAYPGADDGTMSFPGWENIVSVADARSYAAGLRADGTVLVRVFGYAGTLEVSGWKDIVAISADTSLIGLKEDGTVVATGLNEFGEGAVSDWKDIIAVSTSHATTLGLRRDGTVIAAGEDQYGQLQVGSWTDIVAIAAGPYFSLGLKSDGTMVLAGDCSASGAPTPDVSGLTGLKVPTVTIH